MDTEMMTAIERAFSALSREERETIIRHGVALRVADLKKRLFLAESKSPFVCRAVSDYSGAARYKRTPRRCKL